LATYVWSTAVGIIPGSLVDIYIGVIGQNLAGGAQIAYLAAGGIVTMVGAALITLKARNSLRDSEGVEDRLDSGAPYSLIIKSGF
jgi:uncharacterized membrane protein YdjX (TVP38/TMEM64 family)